MTGRPNQTAWYDSLPSPLSEEFITDWVDGRISDSHAASIARAAGRPDIISHVLAMRATRSIMTQLAEMDAGSLTPPQHAAAGTTRDGGFFPVFQPHTLPSPQSVNRFTFPRINAWPLAMAAAVTLAAFLALSTSNRSSLTGSKQTTLAPARIPDSLDTTLATAPSESAMQVASATPEDAPNTDLPSRLVIDADKAIELARQGRLLVRIAASEPDLTSTPLDSLAVGDWHVSDEVSRSLIAAVSPYFGADAGVTPTPKSSGNEERFLTADIFGPPQIPAATHTAMATAQPTRSATYMLRMTNQSRALQGLKHTINSRFGANVLFEELPRSVHDVARGESELSVPLIVEQR